MKKILPAAFLLFTLNLAAQCPVITCPANISVSNTTGSCGANVTYALPTGNNPCGTIIGSQTFNCTAAMQTFVIPAGVTTIHIDARGGQGGTGAGLGARMQGDFAVTPGSTLSIVVGQEGFAQIGGNYQNSSGGGGGTFVYTPSTLMIAAGGGGGMCNYVGSTALHPDANGLTTTAGGASSDGNPGGVSGSGGNAGLWASVPCAGGGTGWLTMGGGPYGGYNAPTWAGGSPFCGGGGGGCGGYGGYGGGGGGGNHYGGGGGGGGYSGGGGGTDPTHGGGGGSYNVGTNQNNTSGFQTGNGLVILSYNVPGPVTITLNSGIASGGFFPVGTTTVSYRATDLTSATALCSFTVNVNDVENPVITCPSNVSIQANTTGCSAIVTWSAPTATDNCTGTTTTSIPASGSVFPLGVSTVIGLATDGSGNTDSCTFTVTVINNLAVSATITPENTGNDGAVNITISGGTLGYTFLWSNASTTEDISGITGGTYTVTITDANGCTVSGSFIVPSNVGIANPDETTAGNLYPNPFTLHATLLFSHEVRAATLRVYNMYGQLVMETSNINGESFQVNAEGFGSGVYVYEVTEKNKKICGGKAVVY